MIAKEIEFLLAESFNVRRNLCVPNLSWGFCWFGEMDFVSISKSGYVTEVEIKTTVYDLRKDRRKKRWLNTMWRERFNELVSQYFIAMPIDVYRKINVGEDIPCCAGIIVVHPKEPKRYSRIEYMRASTKKRGKKLDKDEMYQVARLGTMRYWSNHHFRGYEHEKEK